MHNTPKPKTSTTATEGPRAIHSRLPNIEAAIAETAAKPRLAPSLTTSRPTVPIVPRGHEHNFERADISQSEFLRLPRAGEKCLLTGLSRSGLAAIAREAGAFVSVRLRGRVRGAVLLDRARLVEFLRSKAGKAQSL